MKDYEQRLVAWKERHAIETMLEAMDEDDKANLSIETQSCDDPEDAALRSARVKPIDPIDEGSVDRDTAGATSPLFRELISDCRFQPLSMMDACRHEDISTDERMAVSNFAPLTPIQTSLGDDCTGALIITARGLAVISYYLESLTVLLIQAVSVGGRIFVLSLDVIYPPWITEQSCSRPCQLFWPPGLAST